jgi:hypothetical protein
MPKLKQLFDDADCVMYGDEEVFGHPCIGGYIYTETRSIGWNFDENQDVFLEKDGYAEALTAEEGERIGFRFFKLTPLTLD